MDNKQILLVEDDQNFGDVLSSYLELYQYDVTLANDGVKGWNAFKDGKFDICILDVMMPMVDGFATLEQIKKDERLQNCKVIFLSAKNKDKDIEKGLALGANLYVVKPQCTASKQVHTNYRPYASIPWQYHSIDAHA